jgi:hypothetical protein
VDNCVDDWSAKTLKGLNRAALVKLVIFSPGIIPLPDQWVTSVSLDTAFEFVIKAGPP